MSERKKLIANIIIPCHLFWPFVLFESSRVKQKEIKSQLNDDDESHLENEETFELICMIFRDFSQGNPSFDISHHRYMLHYHCFVVVVVLILWHHIFHLIHLQYNFPCKSREDNNFLKISLKSDQPMTQTCLRSKGKLHEIYHFETASYGFSLGHLFVSMKRQWLIKLKYVWLAINFQKTMQWKVWNLLLLCGDKKVEKVPSK